MKYKSAFLISLALSGCNGEDATPPSDFLQSELQGTSTPASKQPGAKPYTLFESGQVRPLALSADRNYLFAVNTPDNRLEIFRVTDEGLRRRASVPVGLEPVAVSVRNSSEVWVVNHLSDSISIIDISDIDESHVSRTLLVGDEPRDIVFGGANKNRAFITTAHRGQNSVVDPQSTTPGVGRADVWVFDADQLDGSLGGTPLKVITLFSDLPRGLAVSPDGSRVYAAAFHSGNRTTVLDETVVTNNGGTPPPHVNSANVQQPTTGLIVKYNGTHWLDELGRSWDNFVRFSLPDKDVFVIDANANPPAQLAGAAGFFQGVGTVLYNLAVNPVSGKVYVSNTDALNEQRFEGPGVFAGHTLRGRFIRNQISVLDATGAHPRHLNKHIDYSSCCAATPNAESAKSLAIPNGMVVSSNGTTLYVAALGSDKIGIYNTAQLEADTFVPSTADQIKVSGGGPTGLVLDEARRRLYVMTRFDNSVSVVNTSTRRESSHVSMYSPEPASVTRGRRALYDAKTSSSHGDTACASCHVFGDLDQLAWDLGDPDGANTNQPGPFTLDPAVLGLPSGFSAMKGPMTTQSLRGMANHGPMHWRGDRTGGNAAPSAQPDSGTFDERAAFRGFQVAFPGLLGRSDEIPSTDMEAFADFALQLTYPPNPLQQLDNSLTADEQAGKDFIFNVVSEPVIPPFDGTCQGCHTLNPTGNAQFGVSTPGFFGSDGRYSAEPEPQSFKVPHLRNLYQKIGMFGMAQITAVGHGDFSFQGDQIRGFGFLHDGSHDTVFRFTTRFTKTTPFGVFPDSFDDGPAGDPRRRQVESFLYAFPSNLAPIVGQQVTLTRNNGSAVRSRIELLIARANAGECDLVVKGRLREGELGYLYIGGGRFISNRAGRGSTSSAALRDLPATCGQDLALTFTCVPPGAGVRSAIDRDGDGFRDGDELDSCTDPTNPASHR